MCLANLENATTVANFSERRFRAYWDRTAHLGNERLRLAAVRKLIEGEEPLRTDHVPNRANASDTALLF
jgi:hypothetical protein